MTGLAESPALHFRERQARTRQHEKIRRYAQAVSRSLKPEWSGQVGLIEEILETIAELSSNEFVVLRAMWEERQSHREDSGPFQASADAREGRGLDMNALAARLPQFGPGLVIGYVARLQRTGVVVADTQGCLDSMGGSFSVTPLFEQLMTLLEGKGQIHPARNSITILPFLVPFLAPRPSGHTPNSSHFHSSVLCPHTSAPSACPKCAMDARIPNVAQPVT